MEIIAVDVYANPKKAIESLKKQFNFTNDEINILFSVPENDIENEQIIFSDSDRERTFQTEITALASLNSMDDDTRLIACIDELKARYHIGNSILAKIAGIKEDVIEDILANPDKISISLKYSLYSKVVYLLFLFSVRK